MASGTLGYFINDTGKTMQELVQEVRTRNNGYPPLTRVTTFWAKGEWVKEIAVSFEYLDNAMPFILNDKDLAEIDPDEQIILQNGTGKRLGDAAVYKRAVKKFGKFEGAEPKVKAKKSKPKKPAGKSDLQKQFDEWKVEPSKPVDDIMDILKDY